MINVYISLKKEENAENLVSKLIELKLIAHASIDSDNLSYIADGGNVSKQIVSLITAQTKSLLFDDIVKYVHQHYKGEIKIYSLPITQCNEMFSSLIRNQTEKI
jgi:uncharacterized protein involved in tolerance to divalent cations